MRKHFARIGGYLSAATRLETQAQALEANGFDEEAAELREEAAERREHARLLRRRYER